LSLPRRGGRLAAATVLAAALAGLLLALAFPAAGAAAPKPPFRFFSPDSFWNRPLPPDAPIDRRSAAMVRHFNLQIDAERARAGGPHINSSRWSVPVYRVPAGQPTVRVAVTRDRAPDLQAAWEAVPMPTGAAPAAGTDGHMVVWQPSSDRLWEFWRISQGPLGWTAVWGGAMRDVSGSSGVYGPGSWPGATSSWGGSASSISLAGGLITLEDLRRGVINHGLAFSSPEVRATWFTSPAERTDGSSRNPLALPEGAHLRLDPKLDLKKLHLPRLTLMIARAAQRYGMVLRSGSAIVDLYAQDPTPTGTEPYEGPTGFYEGRSSNELLGRFPWRHLQLLQMDLRRGWRYGE
jgi:hypothetical protein